MKEIKMVLLHVICNEMEVIPRGISWLLYFCVKDYLMTYNSFYLMLFPMILLADDRIFDTFTDHNNQ